MTAKKLQQRITALESALKIIIELYKRENIIAMQTEVFYSEWDVWVIRAEELLNNK